MPELDEIQATGALAERVRRAVREQRVELVRDEETNVRAALVPWELLLKLVDAGGPSMEPLRGHLEELASLERKVYPQAQASPRHNGQPEVDPENAASVALLQSWL